MNDRSSPHLQTVMGQPSWRLASDGVEAHVTELGGQLGPVTFNLGDRRVQPFSVAPWAEESLSGDVPPMLRALRGDFFCMPFGGNAEPYHDEQHPPHGETANQPWRCDALERESGAHMLRLSMDAHARPAHLQKQIMVRDGQTAVYCRDTIRGSRGPMCLGHHAMLKFPDAPGSGVISTSPFIHGQVALEPIEDPAQGGYSSLKPGAVFDRLDRVPLNTGEMTDLSRFPARRGFEDLVQLFADPSLPWAWTAVTFPAEGYVWFALKDPRVLTGTVLWISHGGRHYAPWSGRHVNVMGLEEVTSFFHLGLAASAAPNALAERGLTTALQLDPARSLHVNYIMAVAAIPDGFDRVEQIEQTGTGVLLRANNQKETHLGIDTNWLTGSA